MAIPVALGAMTAVRAVDDPPGPSTLRGAEKPSQPRLVDRLRRWLVGPRSSTANAPAARHFDAFEFWALERDERHRRE